jgi:putative transposase
LLTWRKVLQALAVWDKSQSANSTTEACNMFSINRFQSLLKPLSRGQFDRVVQSHAADRYCKKFKTWDQLVVMLASQWGGCQGLRQGVISFNAQQVHHYHLGTGSVSRSTLADANARRNPEVFADIARSLMSQAQACVRSSCGQLLYLLDSTSITLKGREFDQWTIANRTCHTQGVKLHLMYQADSQAPVWHSITAPNVNDRDEGLRMPIEAEATYVFDKGYCDYNWWHSLHTRGARFVTRFKRNAALTVQRERLIPRAAIGVILKDQVVRFTHRHQGGGRRNRYESALRRIEVAREGKAPLVLATNDLKSSAATIAQLYKDRWQIELFFKWIKQHLNIKRFCGHSENAVRIQILIALIAYLLLVLYKQATGATLFQRPSLEAQRYHRRRRSQRSFAALQPGLF